MFQRRQETWACACAWRPVGDPRWPRDRSGRRPAPARACLGGRVREAGLPRARTAHPQRVRPDAASQEPRTTGSLGRTQAEPRQVAGERRLPGRHRISAPLAQQEARGRVTRPDAARATLGQHEVQKPSSTANDSQPQIADLTCGFTDFQHRPVTPRSLSQGGSAGSNPVGGTSRKGPAETLGRGLPLCPAGTDGNRRPTGTCALCEPRIEVLRSHRGEPKPQRAGAACRAECGCLPVGADLWELDPISRRLHDRGPRLAVLRRAARGARPSSGRNIRAKLTGKGLGCRTAGQFHERCEILQFTHPRRA
jgi:hypothetical protein